MSLFKRIEYIENVLKDNNLDDLSSVKDAVASLRYDLLLLYKFVEENVGVRDVSLEKRLRTK